MFRFLLVIGRLVRVIRQACLQDIVPYYDKCLNRNEGRNIYNIHIMHNRHMYNINNYTELQSKYCKSVCKKMLCCIAYCDCFNCSMVLTFGMSSEIYLMFLLGIRAKTIK